MSVIHLLKYNNYYNRIVKQETSLSAYQGYQVKYNGQSSDPNGNTAIIEGVNFIDGDFVDTMQVVNWSGDLPNYLLIVEDNIIKSRWFVVDAQKTRGGQLQLALHRDLIVDYYSNLMSENTSIFVEKATIPSSNDLIFNSEDMSFNQIKTKETLLKDDTGCPWIVLYGARKDGSGQETTFNSTFTTDYPYTEITTQQFDDLNSRVNTPISIVTNNEVYMFGSHEESGDDARYLLKFTDQNPPDFGYDTDTVSIPKPKFKYNALNFVEPIYKNILAQLNDIAPSYSVFINPTLYNAILENQGKFLKYTPAGGTPKYYRIKVRSQYGTTAFPNNYNGAIENILAPLKAAYRDPENVNIGGNIQVFWRCSAITFVLEEIEAPSVSGNSVSIPSTRYHLVDAPYDMFCLPLSDSLYLRNSKRQGMSTGIKSSLFVNLAVANQLIADYSAIGQIYDAQIVPYCPIRNHLIIEGAPGTLIYDIFDENAASSSPILSPSNQVLGYILYASQSSFAFNIDLDDPIVISDYKIESECDLYRLTSPNYAATFEFNAAKNGGVTTFNVKCTYKPFTPYIKLYPDFGRLYGSDFNDARGLICSGDFSLPALTDQWKTYELSNKNYQASFDRQIQNIEINNSVQREREIWGLTAGVVGGGVQGATSGLSVGGPIGAAVGSLLGTGFSLAGGIRDLQLNDKLRSETIDYSKDQFGYQLGNIKALPQTLSKTSAYNIDNKYFPFLEYYTCSEVEKRALRDKIKYNGMTVMAIGTMRYYKVNYNGTDPMYFKGKLIRLSGFDGDYHILNAIAEEIYKGVFI